MGKNVIISTLPNISQNYLPKVNTSNIFANSLVYDNGTNVLIGTTVPSTQYSTAYLTVGNTTAGSVNTIEVRGSQQSALALTKGLTASSTTPTVEIFNSGNFGIVSYRPGVVSSNYLMYYDSDSVSNRSLSFQTEGQNRLIINQNGTVQFTQAITGTSATFSGNVVLGTTALTGGNAAQWLTANGTSYGGGLISSVSGVAKAYYYYDNTANAAVVQGVAGVGVRLLANNAAALTISSTGAATFSNNVTIANGGDLIIKPATSGVDATLYNDIGKLVSTASLVVNGTGEFSSSVTAGQGLFTSSSFPLDLTANTNNYGIRLTSVQAPTLLLYSTFNNANNRNWGIYTNYAVFGDFAIAQSNAKDGDLTTGANGTARLYIKNDGNVGIGTASPNYPLQVNSSTSISRIQLTNSSTGTASGDGFQVIADGVNATLSLPETGYMSFETSNTERMRIDASGNITFGVTTAYDTNLLWRTDFTGVIHGRIYATGAPRIVVVAGESNGVQLTSGATSWTSNSDERLKNINGIIENAVGDINKLRAVKFSWKADKTNKENIGLIAQDIEAVFPQIVDKDEDNILGVRYTEMIPVLVKAIQELKGENDTLKADIESLKALINK